MLAKKPLYTIRELCQARQRAQKIAISDSALIDVRGFDTVLDYLHVRVAVAQSLPGQRLQLIHVHLVLRFPHPLESKHRLFILRVKGSVVELALDLLVELHPTAGGIWILVGTKASPFFNLLIGEKKLFPRSWLRYRRGHNSEVLLSRDRLYLFVGRFCASIISWSCLVIGDNCRLIYLRLRCRVGWLLRSWIYNRLRDHWSNHGWLLRSRRDYRRIRDIRILVWLVNLGLRLRLRLGSDWLGIHWIHEIWLLCVIKSLVLILELLVLHVLLSVWGEAVVRGHRSECIRLVVVHRVRKRRDFAPVRWHGLGGLHILVVRISVE